MRFNIFDDNSRQTVSKSQFFFVVTRGDPGLGLSEGLVKILQENKPPRGSHFDQRFIAG